MCSASGYRSWKHGGKPNGKRLTDAQMLALIQAIHIEFKGAYGSPRMVRELRFPASKERVERLMQENGIRAKHKRRFKVTTDSKYNLPIAPNLLERNFTPDAPNQVWTSDITLSVDGRRLVVSGDCDRPVQPGRGGQVTETVHDSRHRD